MNPKKILVVDDDPEIIELIKEILSPGKYEIFSAGDGAHALEQTNKHQIDLILLDNQMPFFSGIWYCNALKKKPNTKNIPVVFVSGSLDEETIYKAREAGASDFLKKPFKAEQLLKIVEKNISG